MTKDSINLSPKYGVNPSVLHCFICGKETDNVMFNFGNCFKTREEGEVMTEKIKKLLNKGYQIS